MKCVFLAALMMLLVGAWYVGTAAATEGEPSSAARFTVSPIGWVKKADGRTRLVIDKQYEAGLLGLEGFSHVYVYWWFDRNDTPEKRAVLQIHPSPPGNMAHPLTGVSANKVYNYDAQSSENVRVVMEFENSEAAGLGVPLPAGKVRVYKADVDGSLEFIGEDSIDHTPRDEDVKVYVGDAFDIVAERARTDFDRVSDRVTMETYEIKIRNHKEEPVEVVVSEHIYGDWSIRKSSHEYEKKRDFLAEFRLPVDVDGETILTYTVRRRY